MPDADAGPPPGPAAGAAEARDPMTPVARIDLDAMARNVRRLRERAGDAAMLVAVKADAYGHGMVPVARALVREGVGWLGVATPDEALTLRRAGVTCRILLFVPARGPALSRLIQQGIDLTVADGEDVAAIAAAPRPRTPRGSDPIRLHLKVDTGMGRLGLHAGDVVHVARAIRDAPGCEFTAAWTHFARADEVGAGGNDRQLAAYRQALAALGAAGLEPRMRHAANSAALLTIPGARMDLVRPGLAVYGHLGSDALAAVAPDLEPILTLSAPVVFVKRVPAGTPVSYGHAWHAPTDTTIATVRIGYGDGYPRAFGNVGIAHLPGGPARVAGTVCMDQTMFDAGSATVRVGDRAVLLGPDGPDARVEAQRIGTISYELLTRLGPRVRRSYVGGAPGDRD